MDVDQQVVLVGTSVSSTPARGSVSKTSDTKVSELQKEIDGLKMISGAQQLRIQELEKNQRVMQERLRAQERYSRKDSIISSKKFGQTELINMSNQCFSTLFCMQNLKPDNLELFVRPNSKCKIVDYPMIMLAQFLNTAMNIQILYKIVRKSKSRIIFNNKKKQFSPPKKKQMEVKMIKSFKVWKLIAEKH